MLVIAAISRRARLALALFGLAGLAAPTRAEYQMEPAFPNLEFVSPTDIQPANDGTYRMFVLEKRGYIWVFPADVNVQSADAHLFLNLTGKVRNSGEAGLLGLAFDPNYRTNGTFFVFYISAIPSRTIVARYHVSADPNAADPASEVILIDVPQPTVFHNGGQLAFGDDGYLYIAMGDNRVSATAQNLSDLPGSLLRIDVNIDPGLPIPYPPYAIPPDNPFANNNSGYRPEIYAYGFRNPWRFSLDSHTGELFACDVGEDTYEEINLVRSGANYGWPLTEGPACFPPGACDTTGKDLRLPLYSYTHAEGDAIVGGCRYWGSRLPELAGVFVFADYTSGMVWGLHYDGAGVPERFDLAPHNHVMLMLGNGFNGEVLMGALDGVIYRLGRAATAVGHAGARTRMLRNFPNPFNPVTTIRFTLEHAADVRLDIVSVKGERVREFEIPRAAAGAHDVVWQGDTNHGARVASGVYFCRLVVDGRALGATRMVLVQ